jgi:hypothetical protein
LAAEAALGGGAAEDFLLAAMGKTQGETTNTGKHHAKLRL